MTRFFVESTSSTIYVGYAFEGIGPSADEAWRAFEGAVNKVAARRSKAGSDSPPAVDEKTDGTQTE